MVSIYLLCWFSFILFLAGSLFYDVIWGCLGHDNCDHDPDTQNVSITLEWVNHFRCFLGGRCMSGRWKCVQAGEKNSRNIDKNTAYFWKSVRVLIIYSIESIAVAMEAFRNCAKGFVGADCLCVCIQSGGNMQGPPLALKIMQFSGTLKGKTLILSKF